MQTPQASRTSKKQKFRFFNLKTISIRNGDFEEGKALLQQALDEMDVMYELSKSSSEDFQGQLAAHANRSRGLVSWRNYLEQQPRIVAFFVGRPGVSDFLWEVKDFSGQAKRTSELIRQSARATATRREQQNMFRGGTLTEVTILEDERECSVVAPAEVEAKDVELGAEQDLASDVDDDHAEDDPEALDSDDELNKEFGLDLGESDTLKVGPSEDQQRPPNTIHEAGTKPDTETEIPDVVGTDDDADTDDESATIRPSSSPSRRSSLCSLFADYLGNHQGSYPPTPMPVTPIPGADWQSLFNSSPTINGDVYIGCIIGGQLENPTIHCGSGSRNHGARVTHRRTVSRASLP